MSEQQAPEGTNNFIYEIIASDREAGNIPQRGVVTRFPPEPNGYPHIGHAKSICLNFSAAARFGGRCHLRFDDTNPTTEDMAFVRAMERDIRWLGFDWGEHRYHASDYFERFYALAVGLIKAGLAYVCSLSEEDIRTYRGTVTEAGRPSPNRDRSVEENLDLFARMRAGEFADGAHVLRAKIDMAAANMKMRDPLLYRIRHASHYRTKDAWCIYPMYDFAHCLSDAIEGVTHSVCTLEFENNRELYDWIIEKSNVAPEFPPRQYEFARLNLSYTVMSKRKLAQLVREEHVDGWADPRMPTLAGMRRRGIPATAIRNFCDRIGVARANSMVDVAQLEHAVRDALNTEAPRVMAVLQPLKVVLTNFPEGQQAEELDASYWPHDVPKEGSRKVPFGRELYIDRDDFMENPPKRYHRLSPGREVRLRYGYIIRCDEVIKDSATGEVTELRCSYDPDTKSGEPSDGRKVKGTIHWVSAEHAVSAEVRLYDRLFNAEKPDDDPRGYHACLNPDSLTVVSEAKVEPSLAAAQPGDVFQFERQGYFCVDAPEHLPAEGSAAAGGGEQGEQSVQSPRLVFNRTVPLRDSWAKFAEQKQGGEQAVRSEATGKPAKASKGGSGSDKAKAKSKKSAPQLSPEQEAQAAALEQTHGLTPGDARTLATQEFLYECFMAAVSADAAPKSAVKWVVNDLQAVVKTKGAQAVKLSGVELGQLAQLVDSGTLSGAMAKKVFAALVEVGGSPEAYVREHNLQQLTSEAAIEPYVTQVLTEQAESVAAYRAGKTNVFGFLMGQVLAATQKRANPGIAKALLEARLKSDN